MSCLQGERIILFGGAFGFWCLIIRLVGEGRAHMPLPPNSLRLILRVTNSKVAHCVFFSCNICFRYVSVNLLVVKCLPEILLAKKKKRPKGKKKPREEQFLGTDSD